jgi:outer membrane scaffolding protein for murein synthesis (MipA/OmpV family)
MSTPWIFCGLLVATLGWATPCFGEEPSTRERLPLYEYGIVGLAAHFPHYLGADEYQSYVFPLPYFVYRGEVLKADRDGVRTIFFRHQQWETDISLAGNPPAGDNQARQGMEDLDALGEVGPALNYYLFDQGERDNLYFQATLRAAFSFDFEGGVEVRHQGYVSDLSVIFHDSRLFRAQRLRFHLSSGIRFGDAGMHGYFYEVGEEDATVARPSYRAEGGYGGLQLSGSITRELTDSLALSCYGRWANLNGAVYEDSPLVATRNNAFLGLMLVWKIGESTEAAP